MKGPFRPQFLPSSPLRSFLDSEDLVNSTWKFAISVRPLLLDFDIRVQIHACSFLELSSCLYLFIVVETG